MSTPPPAAPAADGSAPWNLVSIGPPDEWVAEEPYDATVRSPEGTHLTALLWSRQTNVEVGATFHTLAIRLETALAVQNESQRQHHFDARFGRLRLHWLRLRRGDEVKDCLSRDRMRLVQRETQLEHHVLNGLWTLIIVLDGVRVGDVIEVGYSHYDSHPIDRGRCNVFYAVPWGLCIGRFRNRVVFSASRTGMALLTSADAPQAADRTEGDRRELLWEGSQLQPRKPEEAVPNSSLDYVWTMASDLTWGDLASRISAAWEGAGAQPPGDPEFARPATVDRQAVGELVRRIQDDFRYLSVDLSTGGWVPAAPESTAAQRFGDCKSLVWLATAVLRSWGVSARPILVGSGLRPKVAELLPSTSLFDHAVLEVECEGERRWFDLTIRMQGGTYSAQPAPVFGFGLPVDAEATALVPQPGRLDGGVYALRESFLVDTREDAPSLVEIRLRAEGWQAENLRRNRAGHGPEAFASERLKHAQGRYGQATRRGELSWRDDRETNVCELAESFELRKFSTPGEGGKKAVFDVPRNIVQDALWIPGEQPRRNPVSLPFPMDLRHTITINSRSMGNKGDSRRRWEGKEYTAFLQETYHSGTWTKTAWLRTTAGEVAVADCAKYRKDLVDFLTAVSWRIFSPRKIARPDGWRAFGELPDKDLGEAAYVSPPKEEDFPPPGEVRSSRSAWLTKGAINDRSLPGGTKFWYFIVAWFAVSALISMLKN